MRSPLCPCAACGRHVRRSERQCPFCRAALVVALALAAGCSEPERSAASAEPAREAASGSAGSSERARRELEEQERRDREIKDALQREVALYGMAPIPSELRSALPSARPRASNCKCKPTDPLCDCL